MPPLRILFIFDRVAHYHKDLFQHLDAMCTQNGNELYLLSGKIPAGDLGRVALKENIIDREFKYRYKEFKVGNFTFRKQLGIIKFIRNIRPDIIVIPSHVGNITSWLLVLLKSILNYKLVSWQCAFEYNESKIKNVLLNFFIPRFDFHLAYHTNAKQYCLAHGAKPEQVIVIHNTINEQSIKLTDKHTAKEIIAEKYPDLTGKRIILYVGAVLKEKNLELVFNSLNRLQRRDIMFVIIGDGPHLPALKEEYRERRDILFIGRVLDGVGIFFDAADFFVLPGTGGLAINEAMAHGLPILSGFADGSADDLVVDGENGYRLHRNSVEELTNLIERIIFDDALLISMGNKSKEMLTEKFSFNSFISRVYNALDSLYPSQANESHISGVSK